MTRSEQIPDTDHRRAQCTRLHLVLLALPGLARPDPDALNWESAMLAEHARMQSLGDFLDAWN